MSSKIERTSPTPPQLGVGDASQTNVLFERIQSAVKFTFDCLIMVWYLIEHACYWLIADRSGRESIFKGRIICKTHNYAKLTELWKYVKLRRNPFVLPEEIKPFVSRHGFTASRTHFWTSPHSKGFCQGGVITFCKEWFNTGDIFKVAEIMEEGVPIEGAVYQEIYTTLFKDKYYPYLVEKIREYIDHYPQRVLLDSNFSNAHVIFEGLQAYLKDHRPEDGGMAEWVREWVFQHEKLRLGGQLYSSLRIAADHYNKLESSGRDRTRAIYQFAGLQTEVLHHNASPGDVLRTVGSLPPGVYDISLPVFGAAGDKNERHAIAFVVQEGGFSYFYEPNNTIAYSLRSEVGETVGRIFQRYTGFDYSENLDGSPPGILKKIANFFQERANPPSEASLSSGFDLYRITPFKREFAV
jgi:hypothetical protein